MNILLYLIGTVHPLHTLFYVFLREPVPSSYLPKYFGKWLEKVIFPSIYRILLVNSTKEPAHGGKPKTVQP